MQNLKIKVNSINAGEAIDLLANLGHKPLSTKRALMSEVEQGSTHIVNNGNGLFTTKHRYNVKEITLAELRDMVVLKRNDIEDATHACESMHHRRGYLSSDGVEYTWSYGQDKWIKSKKSFNENGLKPIKKPMQEYLNTETYEYKLAHTKPDEDWVCIPKGATSAALYDFGGIEFYKNGVGEFFNNREMEWQLYSGSIGGKLVWQRPTQPEALPFIDDNPQSLNEQYAEIEQVRQAVKVKSGSNSDHAADAMAYGFMGIKQDNVNHPSHYTKGKVECIDAIESATVGKTGIDAVCVANIIKYLWRYEEKGGIESIKKAEWYLQKLIENNI